MYRCSVRPKPQFWFRSEPETQNGGYFQADTVTSRNQNFLVTDIMEFFSTIKGPKKPNFLPNIKDFCRSLLNFILFKTSKQNLYSRSKKTWKRNGDILDKEVPYFPRFIELGWSIPGSGVRRYNVKYSGHFETVHRSKNLTFRINKPHTYIDFEFPAKSSNCPC